MSAGTERDAPGPLEAVLAAWLPAQRWYPAKGRHAVPRLVADLTLSAPGAPGDPRVSVLVVDLGAGGEGSALQVPVVRRATPIETRPDAHIGVLHGPEGPRHLYDGPHDPAYVAVVGDLLRGPVTLRSSSGWVSSVPSEPPAAPQDDEAGPAGAAAGPAPPARVLTGEQSNTSIIVTPEDAPPSIVKVFRTLQHGENPDITLQTALARAGSARVPAPVGHLRGGWTGADGAEVVADLLFASEFLAGAEDAWRTATVAVEAGADFGDDAFDLGAATAEVHGALARAMPSGPATPALLAELAEAIGERVDWAAGAVAELGPHAAAAGEVVRRVRGVTQAPPWQRIHGDLHLGQVLRPPGRGWVLLDFEGEPLRPLAQRQRPDTPLRDVAGMLRSFDYAARRVTVGLPPGPDAEAASARADAWAGAARDAYCRGYASAGGGDPRTHRDLLAALELEKALYEVVYEARNRPSWLPIPLHAVRRLLSPGR